VNRDPLQLRRPSAEHVGSVRSRLGRVGILAWSVLALTLLGVAVRYLGLSEQIILDDEWHGLRRAGAQEVSTLTSTQFKGATSIATNVFHRLLLEYWGWSELSVRSLSIAATVVTLVAWPLMVGRAFQSRLLAVLVGLQFALSPFWIFYGQSSRPYAPFLLFTLLALYCLYRTAARRSYWPWLGYGVATALAAYFHLFALPAIAAAALVPLWRLLQLWRRESLRSSAFRRELFRQLSAHALTTLMLVALYLPPYQRGMLDRLPALQGDQSFGWRSLRHGIELLTGTRFVAAGALLLVAALLGLWLATRKNREFVAIFAMSLLGSALFLLATRPYDYHVAIVVLRYDVTAFPLFFLGLGTALIFVVKRAFLRLPARLRPSGRLFPALTAVGLLLAATLAWSPLLRLFVIQPNNFRLHSAYQQNYGKWSLRRAYDSDMFEHDLHQRAADISDFYRELGSQGRPCQLIEYPLMLPDAWNPYYFYQRHHGCSVSIGYSRRCPIGRILHDVDFPERLHFERLVDLENAEALLRSGAEYVVIHLDLDRENQVAHRPVKQGKELRRVARSLTERLGAPVYEDDLIHVYSLKPRAKPAAH
jgi:hypothetical protein